MKVFLVIFLLFPLMSIAQTSEEELLKTYEENIQKEYINGIYIPEDIHDALSKLDELSNDSGRAKFLEAEETVIAERLIHGLGKWITLNWNFYEGSRLCHHLKTYGLSHPEDMAAFIIVSYHRHLRKVPLELHERGKIYKEQRYREQMERIAVRKEIKN